LDGRTNGPKKAKLYIYFYLILIFVLPKEKSKGPKKKEKPLKTGLLKQDGLFLSGEDL